MKKHLMDLTSQYDAARERLKQAVRDLPDSATGVRMLAPNCCSVPFSLIGQHGFNMSPRYYLTKDTKNQLIALIDSNRSPESTVKVIEDILATGKLKDGSKIAPNVIEALKKAWEG